MRSADGDRADMEMIEFPGRMGGIWMDDRNLSRWGVGRYSGI